MVEGYTRSVRQGGITARRRLQVLLVKHDAMAQSLLAQVLAHLEVDTVIAATGREALTIADKRSFHIAVLDGEMQDCSTNEIVESLQRKSPTCCVLILAKFADANPPDPARYAARGDLSEPLEVETAEPVLQVLCASASAVHHSIEAERRCLASELHDGLGQALTAASLMAAAIERKSLNGQAPSISELTTLRQTLEQAQRDCRDLSHRHFRHAVGGEALDHALRTLISRMGTFTDMECVYEGPGGAVPAVPDLVSHHLYRIAQEALCNAIRHSGGSRVTLTLRFARGKVKMSIRDDGRGYNPANHPVGGRIGRLTMRYRAVSLGGTMTVENAIPNGTQVIVELPL